MANPQKENGFMPIANELQEQFIRFSFSKRQHKLLNLLLRLSYGCKQKAAYIPKLKYFTAAGLYAPDVRKELEQLEAARVIHWNRTRALFSINKNYDQWDVPQSLRYDAELMSDLVALQLKRDYKPIKEVSKTLTKDSQEVSKTLTENEYFTNPVVSETLTKELVKHSQDEPANAWESKDEPALKDSIIDNIKDNINTGPPPGFSYDEETGHVFAFFDENIKRLTPFYRERITDWLDEHPAPLLLHVFKHALEVTSSGNSTPLKLIDKILKRMRERGINSIEGFIAAEKEREQQQAQAPARGTKPVRQEMLPEWFNDHQRETQEREPAPQATREEMDRLKAEILERQQRRKEAAK